MTISSTTRNVSYLGDGTTTLFSFPFKVFANADLSVVSVNTTTGATVTESSYVVTLNADQNTAPGGTILMGTAPTASQRLTISSSVPNTQTLDLSNQGGFYPDVINNAFDRSCIQLQQLSDSITRTLRVPAADGTTSNQELPAKELRANKYLAFDVNGAPTASVGSVNPVVSAGSSITLQANNGGSGGSGARNVVVQNYNTTYATFNGTDQTLTLTGTNKSTVTNNTCTQIFAYTPSANYGVSGTQSNHQYQLWANAAAVMTLMPGGNVGVGTTNPLSTVHVHSASAATAGVQITNATTTQGTTADGLSMRIDASGNASVWNGEATPLTFGTNNIERVRIESTGKVGVGTSGGFAPASALHVDSGTGIAGAIQLTNGSTSFITGTSGLQLRLDSAAVAYITNYSATALLFQTSAVQGTPSERLRIASDGTITAQAPIDIATGIRTITTSTTLAATDRFVICNSSAAAMLTLPSAATYKGKEIYVKTIVTSANSISVSPNVLGKNGSSSGTLFTTQTAGNWAFLVSDGTNWNVMAGS